MILRTAAIVALLAGTTLAGADLAQAESRGADRSLLPRANPLFLVTPAPVADGAIAETPPATLPDATLPDGALALAVAPPPALAPSPPAAATLLRPRARPEGLVPAPALADAKPDAADTGMDPVPQGDIELATKLPPSAGPLIRPRARPASLVAAAPSDATVTKATAGGGAVLARSLRPKDRPDDLLLAAAPAPRPARAPEPEPAVKKKTKEPVSKKGSVCGVAAIKGEKIAPISSKVKGCGLADGVRVTSVSGVRLSMPITVDCATATALNTWVADVAQPAYGGKLVELKIAGHYVCRPRNNVKGAKVSEHGRGKAVDVAGFVLSDGRVETVLKNYGKTLRAVHKKACGLFGTTLGPGSDGYHEDHLHLDTASNRKPYCR